MEVEKVTGAHQAVVGRGMVFGEVVGEVVGASAPMDHKLALGHAVTDPIESHIDGFGTALFDGAIGDAGSTGVVGLDRGWGLRVAEIVERGADGGGFFAVMKKGSKFGFSSRGDDNFEDNAGDKNISVFWGRGAIGIDVGREAGVTGAEKEKPPGAATGL